MTADNRADLRLNGSAKSNVCRALTLPWKQTSFPIVQKCICFMFILYLSFYVVLFCSDGFQTPTLTDNIHAIQTVSKLQHRQTTFTLFRRFPNSNTDRQHSRYSDGSNLNSCCNILVFLQHKHLNDT